MEKIGIICEYNPFHKGHLYHLEKIKERYPDSLIILVLNGYFLQRGEISIISKSDKTKLALEYGVDIALELPVLFGTQSADTFAYYAIKILNYLKVDRIIFGSESNNPSKLLEIAEKSSDEKYQMQIKEELAKGVNYPTALAKALKLDFDFLPNDLLGISYAKAIRKINPNIRIETIQRTNSYLDTISDEEIISASNIREKLIEGQDITKHIPFSDLSYINKIDEDLYFKLLKTIIIRDENLQEILDVDEGIEYRLKEVIQKTNNIKEFIEEVKTKRYTYNKINRMLIHILLGIKKVDAQIPLDYLKVLGFNKKGQEYLNECKKELELPLINKDSKIYEYELKASLLYDLLTEKNFTKIELSNKPIIMN